MKQKAKTTGERVAAYRKECAARGYVRREYYATPEEHTALRQHLEELRNAD